MTTTSDNDKNQYTANGSNDTFAYTFKIFTNAEILVDVDGVTQVITTDYTVTGAGTAGGGNVVFEAASIPAASSTVTLTPNPGFTQDIDYVENDNFPASSHEEGLDRSVIRDLKLREELSRAAKVAVNTSSTFDPTLPSPEAGKAIIWNDAEDGFENSPSTMEDVTAVAADIANIDIVAGSISNVNTVATNIAAVSTCASNIVAIQGASANAAAAAASATLADLWATEAEDVVVSGGEYSAYHWAAKAAASAAVVDGTTLSDSGATTKVEVQRVGELNAVHMMANSVDIFKGQSTIMTFNPDSADVDFAIKDDAGNTALGVDAGTGISSLNKVRVWRTLLYIPTVTNDDYDITPYVQGDITIHNIKSICTSGTATATFKINGTPLGGTANSVSSSVQNQAHASANAATTGDAVIVTMSANSSCLGAYFIAEVEGGL